MRFSDGTFWLAEEYRPSLLRAAANGRVDARYVPRGDALSGADTDVHDVLPAVYAARRDNRGFEALAAAGIVPIRKKLVADLAGLRPAMLRDVYGEAAANGDLELKLEGMAIMDSRHVVLVNDNDFGVHAPQGASSPPRTCLWVVAVAAEALRPGPTP